MSVCIETLKQLNLADFLTKHYGLDFKASGDGFVASSPFGADRKPSFFVRQVEGRWLFKDFSSGLGGSIIDCVGHLEHISGVGHILSRIEQLIGGAVLPAVSSAADQAPRPTPGCDIEYLYKHFRRQAPDVCRRYLLERGIDPALIEALITDGDLVHNRHQGKSLCCFVVRDATGALQCLDNHEIEGKDKFVLGQKSASSRDWAVLSSAPEVFITESIIDYLSVKTLEGDDAIGLALLGNQLLFDAPLLAASRRIISALDNDKGGCSAFVDLMQRYPDKELVAYPLEGYKDPNELLQSGPRTKGRRLSAEEKLDLYRAFQRSDNKTELARKWRVDRSHMYTIVRDVEEMVLAGLSSRNPGRRPSKQPATIKEAWQQINQLQEHNQQLSRERDLSFCREEFLQLRLKWSEIEAAELRGEPVDEQTGRLHKPQIKKKEKKETLEMIDSLRDCLPHLSYQDICSVCSHSRSQLYEWRRAETLDRKKREPQTLDENVIKNTAMVISSFPYFGGVKGQAFMLYHELGLIGQKAYGRIKGNVKRVLIQEVSQRKDIPAHADNYEHIQPSGIGEIWAEDFTELVFEGHRFKFALLIDVFSQFILGWALARRATESLVAIPVVQALASNSGKPPEKFLLQDNGKQYVSESHQGLLSSLEIVSRHVPAYTPQYNGAVECGGKEFKNVFYNVIEQQERKESDKEKTVDDRMQQATAESVHLLNDVIPRPALGGVAPADVQFGRKPHRQKQIKEYIKKQKEKDTPPPLSRSFWDVLKEGVKAELMSTKELLTKLAYFGMRPLRRIANLNRKVWGN